MQVYANIDLPECDDYHRMLYVFLCLSEKCINSQKALRCFKSIVKHSDQLFASDKEFNAIYSKTNNQLVGMGYSLEQIIGRAKKEAVEEEDKNEDDPFEMQIREAV